MRMRIQAQRDTFAYRLADIFNDDDKKKNYLDPLSPTSDVSGLDQKDSGALNLPSDFTPSYKNNRPQGNGVYYTKNPNYSGGGGGGSAGTNGGGGAKSNGGSPSGGPPSQSLTEALQRAGIDSAMYPLISGFSAAEGNNPSGAPTLGFTDSQAGTTLDQHAQALAKQLQDRQSVAGPFPHNGSPTDQASWMATVVGQTGNPSDWQGNAQPARSDYVNRIVQNMPSSSPAPAPSTTKPAVQQ